jgi:hypothetical protein
VVFPCQLLATFIPSQLREASKREEIQNYLPTGDRTKSPANRNEKVEEEDDDDGQ